MQVSESTEIIYDKNVVNFSGNDEQCVRSTQKVCTKYPFIHLLHYLLAGHCFRSGFLFRLEQKIGAMTKVAFIGR